MLAILKKEIRAFFTSPIGYMIVGLFLLLNGLFLWVFKGPFNIFDNGFADLGNFFLLAPWVFLLLIPAITMRSLAEEKKLGTLELLYIKPLSLWQLLFGKFLGALMLCAIAVLPTVVYIFCIAALGTTAENYDLGIVIGSYFGLLFLMALYAGIGLFTSSLTENQIVAFIGGVALCFVLFFGFEAIAGLFENTLIQELFRQMGAKAHFESIARGVIDTRDLIYFLSLTLYFLYLAHLRAQKLAKR